MSNLSGETRTKNIPSETILERKERNKLEAHSVECSEYFHSSKFEDQSDIDFKNHDEKCGDFTIVFDRGYGSSPIPDVEVKVLSCGCSTIYYHPTGVTTWFSKARSKERFETANKLIKRGSAIDKGLGF